MCQLFPNPLSKVHLIKNTYFILMFSSFSTVNPDKSKEKFNSGFPPKSWSGNINILNSQKKKIWKISYDELIFLHPLSSLFSLGLISHFSDSIKQKRNLYRLIQDKAPSYTLKTVRGSMVNNFKERNLSLGKAWSEGLNSLLTWDWQINIINWSP